MLSIHYGASGRSRREFLKVGGLTLGGLGLSHLLGSSSQAGSRPAYVRDKSVVFLFLQGGPPQIETFDPKPEAASNIRSITGQVATSLPGVQFGGTFPKLAQWADRLAIVRNFGAGRGGLSHEAGYTAMLSAANPTEAVMGSIYSRIAGTLNPVTAVPSNTILLPEAIDPDLKLGNPSGAFTYRQTLRYMATAGKLGSRYEAFNPFGGTQLLDDMTLNLPQDRFADRRGLLTELDRLRQSHEISGDFETASAMQRQAYDVLHRGISKAFDLSDEDPKTLANYSTEKLVPLAKIRQGGPWYENNFNRTSNLLGHQMLLARRLCEAGAGVVTVVDSCWDFHADGNNPPVERGMSVMGPQADHAIAAFLHDLEDRGLTDDILLIVSAEMGRQPKKSGKGGSGHWGELTPLLLAGGGIKTGQVIGQSDRSGAYPLNDAYGPQHLLTTVMRTLFDPAEARLTTELPPDLLRLLTEGEPIRELF